VHQANVHYHRLSDISFYGNAKNSTPPHRIESSDPIGLKCGTVDYVHEMTPGAKVYANPSMGAGLLGKWVYHKQQVLFICTCIYMYMYV